MSTLGNRKVIQICAASWGDKNDIGTRLYALCYDGTIWYLARDGGWFRIADVPLASP